MYLTRLGTFRHIYIDLAVNLLARFFLKVSCCHFHLLSPDASSNPLATCGRLGLPCTQGMECAISYKIFMLALKKTSLIKSWLNSVVFQSLFEDIKTCLSIKHCFDKKQKGKPFLNDLPYLTFRINMLQYSYVIYFILTYFFDKNRCSTTNQYSAKYRLVVGLGTPIPDPTVTAFFLLLN